MRIAIMQPYFIPYAGYFRLFCTTDLVVVYDCVQFIRRGWVHRNRLPNINGELQWLTLPLKKGPQDVLIKNLAFVENYNDAWMDRLRIFPQLFHKENVNSLLSMLPRLSNTPLGYIVSTMKVICEMLNFPFNISYSSAFNLPVSIKGEDRIIALAKQYGAKEYINLAGGKGLYDVDNFKKHNLQLKFLSDYQGSYESILHRFLEDSATHLHKEIIQQSRL